MATFPCIDDNDFITSYLSRDPQSSLALLDRTRLTLIGFGLVCDFDDPELPAVRKKLWFLAIDPTVRGGGAGSFLLDAILSSVGEGSLCLAPVNEDRIKAWYEKKGFQIVRQLPFIHEDIPTCLMAHTGSDYSTISLNSRRGSEDSQESYRSL
jgi:ribosomal protein S18 acetylase RimI-like enzyme